MPTIPKPLAGLVFLAVVLAASLLLVVSRRPPLTAHEVERDRRWLAALTAATSVEAAARDVPVHLAYTFAGRCGDPLGLALSAQWTRSATAGRPEVHLRFTLHPRPAPGVRGPAPPSLPGFSLLRDDSGSDLVEPGAAGALRVSLRQPQAGGGRGGRAVVDNLRGRRGRRFAQPSVLGLAPPAPGHCQLTAEDLELFALLPSLLRAQICDVLTAAGTRCHDTALAIYRDVRGGRYRIDLRTLGGEPGEVRFAFDVRRAGGELAEGEIRLLPGRHTLRRPARLFVVHPRPRGELLSPSDPGFVALRYEPGAPSPPPRRIDFRVLLAGAG